MSSMQLSFGDAEGLVGRKRTRREVFLAEMDQVVPWKALLALIEPHYPKMGRPGRQPYALTTMLRIHFLQQVARVSEAHPGGMMKEPRVRPAALSGLRC
jgi:IS5 family transposase